LILGGVLFSLYKTRGQELPAKATP